MVSHTDIGCRSLSLLARFLPVDLSYLLGETLAGAYYLLCAERRRAISANLSIVLGPERKGLFRVGFRLMRNFGRNVVETFMLPHLRPERLADMVDISGRERIDRALASNRGVILVTAHLGSWELGGAALAAMGYSITTVAGVQFSPALSPFVKKIKEDLGIDVVSSRTGVRRIVKALEDHKLVALHLDGDQYVGGVEVDFFGRRTRLPSGPAVLAARTGAVVLPAFAIRTGKRRFRLYIEDEIPVGDCGKAEVTRRIVKVLEDYIRRYPDQWCIFKRFWEAR